MSLNGLHTGTKCALEKHFITVELCLPFFAVTAKLYEETEVWHAIQQVVSRNSYLNLTARCVLFSVY